MATIINLSNVTDNSGETPIITYSNPVTTLVDPPTAPPFIPRMAPCPSCPCSQNSCGCNCGCGCNHCCNN
ncbi:MAG: hypothetical protein K2I23_03715 [Clostridia bacterium]|nr:hypothetical protein [Clostridia bacterium]